MAELNIAEVVEQMQQHRAEAYDLEIQLREYLSDHHLDKLQYPESMQMGGLIIFPVIGFHACEESPIGICAYDWALDRAHDHCIFCHQPEERK